MGGAAMIGLGLALAKPKLKVAVITGDGEMLMGMGALATIGVQRPANLAVIVFDNQRYGETGMQASHTDRALISSASRACGIARTFDVQDQAGPETLAGELGSLKETLFARVRIAADDPPRVLPSKDGVELKLRFRKAVAAGISIPGGVRAARFRGANSAPFSSGQAEIRASITRALS